MKKLLLFAAALMTAAGAMAQDIYLGTYKSVTETGYEYKIYKNGTEVQHHYSTTPNFNYYLEDMIATKDGSVYYLNHFQNTEGTEMNHWTDVNKVGGGVIYNSPTGRGIILTGLAYENGDIYASGSYHSDDGRDYGYITKNGSVFYEKTANGYECKMMGITVVNGDVFTCGGEASSEGSGGEDYSYVTVWKNGEPIGNAYVSGQYSYGYDITLYNSNLYICGKVKENGVWKGALWKLSASATSSTNNMTLIGTVSDNASICKHLYQDAGNIYVSYTVTGVESGVYKFNYAETSFSKSFTYHAPSTSVGNIVANNHGVYTAANGGGKYWLDGQEVSVSYTTESIRKIAMICNSSETTYNLPFEDHFENGATYWDDWYTYDYNTQNGYYSAYWDRIDYSGYDDYAAWHHWACNYDNQGADLVSPKIRIPAGYNATLSFYTKVWDLSDMPSNGSRIYITTEDYTPGAGNIIWDMNDHIGEMTEDTWSQFSVDLSEYKGQTIQLIFYYYGECAHDWIVDDVVVTGSYDGIGENSEVALSVMPNPANDVIRVNGLNGTEEVNIINTLGQVVKSAHLSDGQSINISDLSAGVYMLRSENNAQVVKFTVK